MIEKLSRILFNQSTNICFWHPGSTSWNGNHIHVQKFLLIFIWGIWTDNQHFCFPFNSWKLAWQPEWTQQVTTNTALRRRASVCPRILMFTSTSPFLKAGLFFPFCYQSEAAAFLGHFFITWLICSRADGWKNTLPVQIYKTKILLGYPRVATGKFTTLGLY